jgi:ABC-type multidrug transport system fused ATPase/permease subunit
MRDAHIFHDTIRANLLYAKPDATEAELTEVLRAAQILPPTANIVFRGARSCVRRFSRQPISSSSRRRPRIWISVLGQFENRML